MGTYPLDRYEWVPPALLVYEDTHVKLIKTYLPGKPTYQLEWKPEEPKKKEDRWYDDWM
jgi:hypothetical protein